MALRQRIEKKGTAYQAQSKLACRNSPVNTEISAHTVAVGKYSYACNLNNNNNNNNNNSTSSTGTYQYASNTNAPTYVLPANKHSYICNATMPVQNVSKTQQPVNNPISKYCQQAKLDVAVPSSFWRLQQHVSLDFDTHRQKVIPKRNQIAAAWRHLSPQLKWKKHENTVVADVFEVPQGLFQLKDLKDVLSLEAWKECLSLSERRFLRQLLPEGLDHGSVVRTLLRGDNFYFGSPLANWGSRLLKGEMHPDCIEQREVGLKQAYDEHYLEVENYHEKMLETLRELKEEWILCKSKKSKHSSKTRRRKLRRPVSKAVVDDAFEASASWQNSKRQKVAVQQASETIELPPIEDTLNTRIKLENGIHSDGSTQSMCVVKVTRKQYGDILLLMGKEEELSVATLSPLLSFQQKYEASCCANDCDEEDSVKVRKHWSELVVADITAGHIAFVQKKAEKHNISKLTAEYCMQYHSALMVKDVRMDFQNCSNTVLPSELEKPALGFQGSIEIHSSSRCLSASESSVTCLEGKAENQGAVDSCLSSADSTEKALSQHLIQEDQVSLIDLPHGCSLVTEGHATLLTPVQTPRERTKFEDHHLFDGHDRQLTGNSTAPQQETDIISGCNQGFVAKTSSLKGSLGLQGIDSHGKELVNWDIHSKPASDVVSAAAVSGESEEVEQRVSLQSGGDLDQLYCLSAPSSLTSQGETTGKDPLFASKYIANTKNEECKQYQGLHQKIFNLNIMGRSPLSVPSTEEVCHSEKVHGNDSSQVFEMDCRQIENEKNNQMMLHLFLDNPKLHSNDFLSTDASSSQGLQGKSSFCESNEVPSVTFPGVSNSMIRENEPVTELSLLVDDRTAKKTYQTHEAESISSRTQNEYFQQCTMEPHWISRHNRQEEPVYPFRQHLHELHHLVQSNHDGCSPIAFSPMQPIWQQSNVGAVSQPSFANYWNIEEPVDQTNWMSSDGTVGSLFLPGKDEVGRPPVSQYWDQACQGPSMSSQSTKHDPSLFRSNTLNLRDEHMYVSLDNWTRLQSQASSHLPCTWTMDRSGRIPSHPWKNAPVLSSLHYDQQKLQNAALSKLNPNFTTSWH